MVIDEKQRNMIATNYFCYDFVKAAQVIQSSELRQLVQIGLNVITCE